MGTRFQVGDWFVQPDLNQISKAGLVVLVEPKAMDVLVCLAASPGEVFSRDRIREKVWKETHVSNDALSYTISELRKAFGDNAKKPRIIQTIPRRGYRLIAAVSTPAPGPLQPEVKAEGTGAAGLRRKRVLLPVSVLLLLLVAGLSLWYLHSAPGLTTADYIILTDFTNTTGDSVFDDALPEALAIHLKQSPFLNIFPEERARETLPYMGRSFQEPLTKEICREICQRRGIRAMIAGSIASLGRNYVISLEAINGRTGEVIARRQEQATRKEDVLKALGKAATDIRQQLGESLDSIERFDRPLEQATTSSLEAFKSYSLGRIRLVSGRWAEAVPHYLRALELDPQFASAYDDLSWCYANLWEPDLAAEAARKAFSLRAKVSEYERLSISALYYTLATGEIQKALEALEMMRAIFPRSAPVHNTLGGRYASVGRLEDAIKSYQEAIRLNQHPNAFSGLAGVYLRLNRWSDAKKTIADARACGIDNQDLRSLSYLIAFFEEDRATMDEQVQSARDDTDKFRMRNLQAAAAAFRGRLREARKYSYEAIEAARRSGMTQAASELEAEEVWREALFGRRLPPDQLRSLGSASSWPVLLQNTITLILYGELDAARPLVDQLEKNYSGLNQIRPACVTALRELIEMETGRGPQELSGIRGGVPQSLVFLYGKALLQQEAPKAAEIEFLKILKTKRGDSLSPLYPLSHLEVARTAAALGEIDRSRKSYEDFFAFWKSPDPDLPVLEQARSEYASLKQEQTVAHRIPGTVGPTGTSPE